MELFAAAAPERAFRLAEAYLNQNQTPKMQEDNATSGRTFFTTHHWHEVHKLASPLTHVLARKRGLKTAANSQSSSRHWQVALRILHIIMNRSCPKDDFSQII